MATSPEIQAFLYRVVTTNDRVEKLIEEGRLKEAPARSASASGSGSAIEDFSIEAQVKAKRMGAVYELLYCLENSMRELVESTLKETLGPDKWWDEGVPEAIRKSAESRASDDERAPWHGPRGESLLNYIDFPQLADIITGRWSDFRDLLGDRVWVENYFRELNRSRRALAHTGDLTQQDVDWMEFRVKQWLQVVG